LGWAYFATAQAEIKYICSQLNNLLTVNNNNPFHAAPQTLSKYLFLNHITGNKCGKHLVLCRELNPSLALTGKPSKNSPAVTALAMSRYGPVLCIVAYARQRAPHEPQCLH